LATNRSAITIDFRVNRHIDDEVGGAVGTSPSRHAESFVRDGQELLYPVWSDPDGHETMVLDEMRVVYRLARLERDVRILARAGAWPNISPAQLCDLMGVEPSTGGALAAIVFPTPAPHDLLHLEPLAGEAAVDALTTALFGGVGPWRTAGLWLDPSFEDRPSPSTRTPCAAQWLRASRYSRAGSARVRSAIHVLSWISSAR
jgi:hypothetical protein